MNALMTLVFLSDISVHHKWLDIIDSSVQNFDEKNPYNYCIYLHTV